jgi:hypothetical protein
MLFGSGFITKQGWLARSESDDCGRLEVITVSVML